MTTFFLTHREHYVNDGPQHALDRKRRSERLARLSGAPYTTVRPGRLDNGPAGNHITIEHGDITDARISQEILSSVLVQALLSAEAAGKTFEAFSGPARPPETGTGYSPEPSGISPAHSMPPMRGVPQTLPGPAVCTIPAGTGSWRVTDMTPFLPRSNGHSHWPFSYP